MKYEQFIQPEIINVGDREFAISKIPAFQAKSVYNDLVVKIRDNGDIGKTMLSDESIKTMFRSAQFATTMAKCRFLRRSPP